MKPIIMTIIATSLFLANACKPSPGDQQNEVLLRGNWKISSSANVSETGEVISKKEFATTNWIDAH
ncbi:MAG TPA: hypothetical protein PLS94_08480, partial [Prolixibacteraceae bacterium]|nr:hypothetical protein [Prolixibacteraceae bacterium]